MKRNAKIVCTLGPSSDSYEMISALVRAGMDIARLNFSHGTHASHKKVIGLIRQVSEEMNKHIAVLQDLQGPKIRVGKFGHDPVLLKAGSGFTLTTREITGTSEIASVSYSSFARDVKAGDTILLDDGMIRLEVIDIEESDVHCKIIYGGVLSDHKGINLPGAVLSVDALTDKDLKDLEFGIANDVDFVALSFVQRPDDIRLVKRIIADAGKDIPVVAKIEKPQAVECIESITDITDIVMVARGDLGVEASAEQVPVLQKKIISLCNQKGIPVITATQMLESMIHNPRPTRAEASDVANAILDGSDAVMLSGETASGQYPVQTVETMSRIIELIEKTGPPRWDLRRARRDLSYDPALTIGYSACHASDLLDGATIICLTQTGSTAQMISRFRPADPIIAVTHSLTSLRRMAIFWGVQAIKIEEFKDNIDEAIEDVENHLVKLGLVHPGDKVIVTAGLPFYLRRGTNMLRIEEVGQKTQS